MKRKNRRKRIYFEVFGYKLTVILAQDLVKTGRRLGGNLQGASAGFIYKDDKTPKGYLVLPLHPDPELIAHESSHVIRHMFDTTGMGLDDENFAYHLGYLVGEVFKIYRTALLGKKRDPVPSDEGGTSVAPVEKQEHSSPLTPL